MSLDRDRKGYAVMSPDLKGIFIDGDRLDELKQYCRGKNIIAERIPYVIGFSIRIFWAKPWKPLYFRSKPKNILWLHWMTDKEYAHKTGAIVWSNKDAERLADKAGGKGE